MLCSVFACTVISVVSRFDKPSLMLMPFHIA
uniref:Uncharacterized protein n=1 Tax=Anguilla anguilla TaxID=7936 RepID=A0A0E9Q8C5_ANGAN